MKNCNISQQIVRLFLPNRIRIWPIVCLSMLAQIPLYAQTYGVYPDRIVIHHVGPAIGVAAPPNKEAVDAAQIYIDKVNASGGVNGRQIVIERIDDKQDVKLTQQITQELIDKKTALALFLYRTTGSIQAAIPIAEAAGIPFIAPQTGGLFITEPPKKSVFAIRASYQTEVQRAIDLQVLLGKQRFVIAVPNDLFGEDTLAAANRAFGRQKIKPLVIEKYDSVKPDMANAIDAFFKNEPEVILAFGSNKAVSDLIKGLRSKGSTAQFIALSNNSSDSFIKALDGKYYGVIVQQVMPSPWLAKTKLSREYQLAAEAAKLPVSYTGLQGYASGQLLVEGLRRAGRNPTPTSLTQALVSLRNYDMGNFVVNFGAGERMGSKYIESSMISREGRFIQ